MPCKTCMSWFIDVTRQRKYQNFFGTYYNDRMNVVFLSRIKQIQLVQLTYIDALTVIVCQGIKLVTRGNRLSLVGDRTYSDFRTTATIPSCVLFSLHWLLYRQATVQTAALHDFGLSSPILAYVRFILFTDKDRSFCSCFLFHCNFSFQVSCSMKHC